MVVPSLTGMSSAPSSGMCAVSPFDRSATGRTLAAACREQGLDGAGAALLRHGENAMYRLRELPVIVRVARHTDTPRKEVAVARWLAEHDFPAVRLRDDLRQLQVIGDRVVTWWELIDEDPQPPRFAELALLLRRLHDLPAPAAFALPPFTPMPRVLGRLDRATGLVWKDDVAFLRALHGRLLERFDRLTFELPPGPIHGDAHVRNLMRGRDGTVRLIDFEAFSWGPREWDACILGAAYAAFGWMDRDQYDRCVAAYGWDPLGWDGFPVFRAVRELNMTTWLMQRLGESAEIDEEIAKRIADLRRGDGRRRWRQF